MSVINASNFKFMNKLFQLLPLQSFISYNPGSNFQPDKQIKEIKKTLPYT